MTRKEYMDNRKKENPDYWKQYSKKYKVGEIYINRDTTKYKSLKCRAENEIINGIYFFQFENIEKYIFDSEDYIYISQTNKEINVEIMNELEKAHIKRLLTPQIYRDGVRINKKECKKLKNIYLKLKNDRQERIL